VGAIRASIERTARAVSARADEIAKARQNLDVPILTPIEAREATMRYAFGAALGGWVTAIALDLLPLLLLGDVMTTSREDLLIRERVRDFRRANNYDYDGDYYGLSARGDAAVSPTTEPERSTAAE
jgi:hypothetical protein